RACGIIYNLIDAGYTERILRVSLFEVLVITAHAPRPVLLFHQDRVGQPVGVVNLPDEVCGRELRELISDGSFRSCANQRRRCLTGFAPSLTFRQCSITSRGTPGLSEGFQAKMSWFAWRKVMSALSYLSPRPVPISAILAGSDGSSVIFLTSWSALIPVLAAFFVGTSPSSRRVAAVRRMESWSAFARMFSTMLQLSWSQSYDR